MLLDVIGEGNNDGMDEDALNFNDGYAGIMIDKIVGYADIDKVRARNKERAVFGTNKKELLK